jgi:hypothetical protein
MSYKNQFTSDEWNQLELAPFWMFFLVAGIDAKVDKKEMEEFAKQVVIAPSHSNVFGTEVFESLQRNIASLLANAGRQSPLEGLRDVSELLDRLPKEQVDDFIASLVMIGHRVTDSSGKLFRKNVSEKETAALVLATAILQGKALAR